MTFDSLILNAEYELSTDSSQGFQGLEEPSEQLFSEVRLKLKKTIIFLQKTPKTSFHFEK
jgi:hypothetical protein